MIIKVTQEDIDNGKKKSCYECPIALAIQRVSVKHLRCDVMNQQVYAVEKDLRPVWIRILPPEAQLFIIDFDAGKSVKPFQFELDIQEKYLCDQAA